MYTWLDDICHRSLACAILIPGKPDSSISQSNKQSDHRWDNANHDHSVKKVWVLNESWSFSRYGRELINRSIIQSVGNIDCMLFYTQRSVIKPMTATIRQQMIKEATRSQSNSQSIRQLVFARQRARSRWIKSAISMTVTRCKYAKKVYRMYRLIMLRTNTLYTTIHIYLWLHPKFR